MSDALAAIQRLPSGLVSPPAPVRIPVRFPVGDFVVGGFVEDLNSPLSPGLDVSIGNWIEVESR
jgi:hypothetical protein